MNKFEIKISNENILQKKSSTLGNIYIDVSWEKSILDFYCFIMIFKLYMEEMDAYRMLGRYNNNLYTTW